MSRIRFGQVIHCATCRSHLESFARRARCVFGCGAWYCRRGTDCRNKHAETCTALAELRALDVALATSAPPPHTGHDCPNRIEVTSWGMTDREWICGCDPRPDATAPAETTSPSEAP